MPSVEAVNGGVVFARICDGVVKEEEAASGSGGGGGGGGDAGGEGFVANCLDISTSATRDIDVVGTSVVLLICCTGGLSFLSSTTSSIGDLDPLSEAEWFIGTR